MTTRRSLRSFAALVWRHRAWSVAAVVLIAIALAGAGWLAFWRTSTDATLSPQRASCVRPLLADWADGRIDRTYPLSCYREALESLPADLEVYSSAPEDIESALRNRIVQGAVARHSTR